MARSTNVLPAYAGVGYRSIGGSTIPDGRLCVLAGWNTAGYPTAGGDVDGAIGRFTEAYSGSPMFFPAVPGFVVQVEAGESFGAGTLLDTQADGRVVAHGTGRAVMRALENGSAGVLTWAVFVSGR